MVRTIAVMNQKGGVGKTTTTTNLAHAFSRRGLRVLAIDMDPQAHLSASLMGQVVDQQGIDQILLHEQPLAEAIQPVREKLDLITAGDHLAEFQYQHEGGAKRGFKLREALEGRIEAYDIVLIDCPPSSALLGINAILAADELLTPVTGDYLALRGLTTLIQVLRDIERLMGHAPEQRFVLTRFHERRRLAREVRDKLCSYFPGQVLQTHIREVVALAESPSYGKTIFEYQPKGHGAEDYERLAGDFLQENYAV